MLDRTYLYAGMYTNRANSRVQGHCQDRTLGHSKTPSPAPTGKGDRYFRSIVNPSPHRPKCGMDRSPLWGTRVSMLVQNAVKRQALATPIPLYDQLVIQGDLAPDTPLDFVPYPLGPQRPPWYLVVCTHTGRPFGGRFTGDEIDHIAAAARGWGAGPVPPLTFGTWAADAIAATRQGVAA